VISNGFGAMPDYAAQIKPEDRWAIAAYIRALQLSQDANAADVAAADRDKLNAPAPVIKTPSNSRNDLESITREPGEGGAKK
jgi:hypothetical protein